MNAAAFAKSCGLSGMNEVAKCCHLAFYYLKAEGVQEFDAGTCATWLDALSLPKPNASRLTTNLKASRDTVRGSRDGTFRLHHDFQHTMETRYGRLFEKPQEVQDLGTVLPGVLYENTRGYIESLAKQINRSYEENIFDGCAVLMRRLEEVLLILAYEHLKIGDQIRDKEGHYQLLEGIAANAAGNPTLNLSRNSRQSIETFRKLGNYSAHKITYTCKREYIKEKIDDYRALIDELLHKAGLKT